MAWLRADLNKTLNCSHGFVRMLSLHGAAMTRLRRAAQQTGDKRSRLETARRGDAAMIRWRRAAQQTGEKRSRLETARRADAAMTRLRRPAQQTGDKRSRLETA